MTFFIIMPISSNTANEARNDGDSRVEQRVRKTANEARNDGDNCRVEQRVSNLEPRLQLQRLVLVIREIRPRNRRIHVTHIALILNVSLRLTMHTRNTIFKY